MSVHTNNVQRLATVGIYMFGKIKCLLLLLLLLLLGAGRRLVFIHQSEEGHFKVRHFTRNDVMAAILKV